MNEKVLTDFAGYARSLDRRIRRVEVLEVGGFVDISGSVSLYQSAAVSASVNYAKAFVTNKKATVIARLSATASGTAGNDVYMLLPSTLIPATGSETRQPLGSGEYFDAGTALYDGTVVYAANVSGLPALGLKVSTITDSNVIGTNPNIAVANTDVFGVNVTFEIA